MRLINKKSIINHWLIFILIGLLSIHTIAQNDLTKGSMILQDNSVGVKSLAPLPFSILELNSKENGFLLPRLTTNERLAIPSSDLQAGVLIYNTTIDCVEFYSGVRQRWLNLCGDVEPAIFTIQESKCSSLRIDGNYSEGVFLISRANVISLEVNVSVPGTYKINAVAYNGGNENGYTFEASGVFPESGNYTIILRGSGTPIKGYDRDITGKPTSKGDLIKLFFNEKEVPCTAYNFVESKALQYKVDRIDAIGSFFTKVALTDNRSGKLEATIKDITMGGTIDIYTVLQNGMRFSAKRALTNNEISAKTAKITLKGEGAADIPIVTAFDFYTNSYVKKELGEMTDYYTSNVKIEKVNVDFQCNNVTNTITHEGHFEYNIPLTSDNKIIVPVKVLAPGRAELRGVVDVNGTGYGYQSEEIEFTSGIVDLEFNESNNDIQEIVLYPKENTGKPTIGKKDLNVKLSLVSNGAYDYGHTYPKDNIIINGCNYALPVEGGPVIYKINTIQLNSIFKSISNGLKTPYITPKTKMPDDGSMDFTLDLNVLPTSAGEYEIMTNELNGIKFYAKGIIEETDVINKKMTIRLKAYGQSQTDLPANNAEYVIQTNSEVPQVTGNTIKVDFVYRPMKMYSIGGSNQSWHPGGNNSWSYGGGPRLIRTLNNFGWNGIVRIDKLDIIGIPNAQSGGYVDYTGQITNDINGFKANVDKADMIFIGGYNAGNIGRKGVAQLAYLKDYITSKSGVLVYGEGNSDDMSRFMSNMGYEIKTSNMSNNQQYAGNRVVATANDKTKLILGSTSNYFGISYKNVSLMNKLIGAFSNSTSFFINNLPNDFEPIAYLNGTNDTRGSSFAYVHNNYGFVGVNNSTFMGGYSNETRNVVRNNYPISSNANGVPNTVRYNGGETFNSWFLLNLVHWAIDYAQENQDNSIK